MKDNLEANNAKGSGEFKKFLSFTIASSEYAVDIMAVREIRVWSEVTKLPNAPKEMLGVMNLRGIIMPIFDLRRRFGIGETNATAKNVVIILKAGERNVGILVDAVSDILDVEENNIKPAPTNEMEIDDKYIKGLISISERMVILLDMEQLFCANMMKKIDEQMKA